MLIIPFRVDGPADHGPWATIVLILVNTLVTFLLGFPGSGGAVDSLLLRFGSFNPLTWVSCVFVHYDALHLLFNMLFLWWFGVIVEGLSGWRKFLGLYLAIGVVVSAVVQILMLGAEGTAAGASGAIFGALAVAALWAPETKVATYVLLPFMFKGGLRQIDFTVRGLALIYLCLEFLSFAFAGFSMSSALIHLFGAAAGIGVGTWMLREGHVDSGGWDWYSLRKGRPQQARAEIGTTALPRRTPADFLVSIREALGDGEGLAANELYESARAEHPGFVLPHEEGKRLLEVLARSHAPEVAIGRMEEYLRTHSDGGVRLTLARLLLSVKRPRGALDQLEQIEPSSEGQRAATEELRAEARGVLGSTGLELE